MSGHQKKTLQRGQKLKITVYKIIRGHQLAHNCSCSDIVVNLIEGDRVWTRVEFECGELKKINVHCLEEIEQGL